MVIFTNGHNVSDLSVRVLPCIIVLSICIPTLLYINVKSLTMYLETIKMHDTIESVINDTSEQLRRLQRQPALNYLSKFPETTQRKLTRNGGSSTSTTILYTQSTARPLACHQCFSLQFDYIVNNENICKSTNGSINILILIISAPQNALARKTIRDTWLTYAGNNNRSVRYVFLIGESSEDEEVRKENALTKDIILGNFRDTYSNLTLKVLMGFQWTVKYCNNAEFILKTDDDMYVNIPSLINNVQKHRDMLQKAVGGFCYRTAGPIRDRRSKWYASFKSYPQKTYPGFCSGTGYVTSFNVVTKIVHISKNIPFFHLEDVYVSLCIHKLGFKLHNMKGFMIERNSDLCLYKNESVVTAHEISVHMMRDIWKTNCSLSSF